MGLHIMVRNKKLDWHPTWDALRVARDRDFCNLLAETEGEYVCDPEEGDVIGMRPKDVSALRRRILETDWANKDRYLQLCDILESDAGWGIHISV